MYWSVLYFVLWMPMLMDCHWQCLWIAEIAFINFHVIWLLASDFLARCIEELYEEGGGTDDLFAHHWGAFPTARVFQWRFHCFSFVTLHPCTLICSYRRLTRKTEDFTPIRWWTSCWARFISWKQSRRPQFWNGPIIHRPVPRLENHSHPFLHGFRRQMRMRTSDCVGTTYSGTLNSGVLVFRIGLLLVNDWRLRLIVSLCF